MIFYALKNPAPKKVKDNNNFETKEKHDERQREEEWKKCNSKKRKKIQSPQERERLEF